MSRHGIPSAGRQLLAVLIAPAIVIALGVAFGALLPGCIDDTGTTPAQLVRETAIQLRRDVGEITDKVDAAAYAVVFVCNVRGEDSTDCDVLKSAHRVASSLAVAANKAIDLYDATGVQLAALQDAITLARDAADTLQDKAARAERALREALRSFDSAGQAAGLVDRPPGSEAGATPAAPTGPQPEAAGPAQ